VSTRRALADRRGSTLPIVLVLLTVILSLAAVAVDVGMLYTARSEAQRSADAAALAGASAFVDLPPRMAPDSALGRAVAIAAQNPVQSQAVQPGEVTVQVVEDSSKVRVWIRRGTVGTLFARVFGVQSAIVSARAAAWAQPVPKTDCVKPFAPPDFWHDADDDLNRNRIPDGLEIWKYEEKLGDYFRPYTGAVTATPAETGFRSRYRGADRDFGRQVVVKITDADLTQVPGLFYLWHLDPSDVAGASLRDWIRRCHPATFQTGKQYKLLGGDRQGPVYQAVQELIQQDPGAYWSPQTQRVEGSRVSPWWKSPRIVKVPFYDPRTLGKDKHVKFTHFSWVFIEGQKSDNDPVLARYLNFVRQLKLVE